MTAPVFVDTNVLIYAHDLADPKKLLIAQKWRAELWNSGRGRISFQVLQEFYAKVTQIRPAAREQARAEVRDLIAWRPVAVDARLLESAWKVQERFQFSFWDSLIVAAAKAASCRWLLTEDSQAGQDLEGLLVLDPFSTDPSSVL
jgi:predicted nucleic acid-binding protein